MIAWKHGSQRTIVLASATISDQGRTEKRGSKQWRAKNRDRGSLESTVTNIRTNLQGKLYVRGDSKTFRFQNGKTESLFLQRKNPRRIAWTVLCRRQRRKGISEVRKGTAIIFKHLGLGHNR